MKTTYVDVVEHFAGRSPKAAAELERWRRAAGSAKLAFVESAVTDVVYRQSPEMLDAVCERGDHPLGNIQKAVICEIDTATNWNPDFAFQHALHHATESRGSIPTFSEFARFCADDPLGRMMLADPAGVARSAAEDAGADAQTAWDAVRWRIGLAYYSFVREIYALAVLRAAGIDARCHVLPDVLWRVDLWVDDLCIEMYVANSKFKSQAVGRKTRAHDWLGDGPFRFVKLEMARRTQYGIAHLPEPDDLVRLVQERI